MSTTILPPGFVILPCVPEDVDSMVSVNLAAFEDNFFNDHIWPRRPEYMPSTIAWLRERYLAGFLRDEEVTHKLVDTSVTPNRIAAWSRWIVPHTLSAEEKSRRQVLSDTEEALIASKKKTRFPEGVQEDLAIRFFGTLGEIQKRLIDPSQTWVLSLLAVDPAYQRRGLGTVVLKYMLEQVNASGNKAYLEAMPAGHGLYKKLGWEDVELMELDMSSIGVKESGKIICMVRPGVAES